MPNLIVSSAIDTLMDADTEAEARTAIDAVGTDPTGVTGADAVTNVMSLTQAEYNAIGAPNAATLYVITD